MSSAPTSFAEWQTYPLTLDPIHVAWLKQAKQAKTAFAVADIEGIEISHKRFLTIVDRYSRFAKIGGEMISLTTVEEEILDACDDKNLEIAATCLPDQVKGEKIVLLATTDLNKDELKKLLTEANINPLYHPAKVLSVEEIPKLGSGKNDYGATKKIALANPN